MGTTNEEREGRKQLCDFVLRSYHHNMIISTSGAFSMRLGTDFMLITPSGIDRATISPSDLVLVRMSDSAFDASSHLPASRAVHNHAAIYQRHPHVNAIMNGLSPTLPLSTATWSDFLFSFFHSLNCSFFFWVFVVPPR